MALIVQKFGGSSVKDRDRIFNVARIVANTHNAGNDVVVVVSAQGDTTDDLIAKAGEITHNPSAREMDMLLASGEQISIALLAMALNDGKNPMNGEQCSYHTGYLYEMKNIEQVRQAVRGLADYLTREFIAVQNYTEYLAAYHHPHALLSMTIEGCMEAGLDVSSGGAKYNNFGGTATGLATIADSISTIKYMCFDQKLCTTRELYDAVMANWEGYEELRQTILEKVPHFGNDDDYVDDEMRWICGLYYDLCKQSTIKRGNKIIGCTGGLYGASNHVAQGYDTWATPDGRIPRCSPGKMESKS